MGQGLAACRRQGLATQAERATPEAQVVVMLLVAAGLVVLLVVLPVALPGRVVMLLGADWK